MKQIESLERRQLLTVTIDQSHAGTLHDSDGSTISIQMTGPGTAFADEVAGGFALSVAKSTAATTLRIDVTGGNQIAIARAIKISGEFGSIIAPAVELGGAISSKSIAQLDVRGLSGANVSTGWLGALGAKRISNSSINADRIGSLSIKGDVTNTRVHVSPARDDQAAITSANIRGTITDSTIFTLGDINTFSAGAMIRSKLTAGVIFSTESTAGQLIQPLPNERNDDKLFDFTGKYKIANATVGAAGAAVAFSESIIGAYDLGNIALTNVDGHRTVRPEFGVAGFIVDRVRRTFDAANASKNTEASPFANFTVRQISAPLSFDPATGSYGLGDNDVVFHNAGVFTTIGTLPGQTTWSMGKNGLQIGTLENHRAHALYLASDGRYELRNKNNVAIARRTELPVLIDDLFSGEHSASIKISRPGEFGTMTLRATSTGPSLKLSQEYLGDNVSLNESGTPVMFNGYPIFGQPPVIIIGGQPPASVVSFTVPTFDAISVGLKRRGNSLAVYREEFLLVTEPSMNMGTMIGMNGASAIDLSQSLGLTANGVSKTSLVELIVASSADRIGSRRLPARWVEIGNTVRIYGLPNGGTAVLSNLGRVALNATGEAAVIPSMKSLKQSLIAADIGL